MKTGLKSSQAVLLDPSIILDCHTGLQSQPSEPSATPQPQDIAKACDSDHALYLLKALKSPLPQSPGSRPTFLFSRFPLRATQVTRAVGPFPAHPALLHTTTPLRKLSPLPGSPFPRSTSQFTFGI